MKPCDWCDRETQITCPECKGLGLVEEAERVHKEVELQANEPKVCDRIFADGGAHTMIIIDGIACCPSCKQPAKKHRRKP